MVLKDGKVETLLVEDGQAFDKLKFFMFWKIQFFEGWDGCHRENLRQRTSEDTLSFEILAST